MITLHNIYGVAGKPILHSKSPDVFNFINQVFGFSDNSYIRIVADSPEEIIEIVRNLGLKGLNITSPYKMDVMNYLDEISEEARIVSSVNVITNKDNRLIGYNTDYIGVFETIKRNIPDWKEKKYLVIGCGGAGRAAVYGLKEQSVNVTIINRTNHKAEEFAVRVNCRYADWNNLLDEIKIADVCINTVPSAYLNLENLYQTWQYVLNADYNIKNISTHYNNISGLQWLFFQAKPSFQFLTEMDLENEINFEEKLFRILDSDISGVQKKKNIALIGFMGSGKTTVGRILAEKMNWGFVDTDEMIVSKENIPIREIFKRYGEVYFRNLEKEVINNLRDKEGLVISCGGGLILDDDNRELLHKTSNIFWIYSPVDVCIERLKSELRPPLTNPFDSLTDPLEKAEILFNYRIPYYCEIADAMFYNNCSIDDAVKKIYEDVHTYFGY